MKCTKTTYLLIKHLSFDKKQTAKECIESKINSKVKTAGRLMTKRDLGKITFANLRDESGEIQIVLQDEETSAEQMEFFKKYIWY